MPIDFNADAAQPEALPTTSATVWTKGTWSAVWTERPELFCTEARWVPFPEISSAMFQRYWGAVMVPGDWTARPYARLDLRGHFVLVRIDTIDNAAPRWWLGYIDSQRPTPVSAGGETGADTLTAYGLERALQVTPITESVWNDTLVPRRVGLPVAFNAGGRPNRTDTAVDGAHLFEHDPQAAQFWTSRDVLTYLLTHQLPTPTGGASGIPWTIEDANLVPDWDSVSIETRGRTVWDLLGEVISERRMLGAAVQYTVTQVGAAAPIVDALKFRPYTTSHVELQLVDRTFPASLRIIDWYFDADPLTSATISESSLDAYDQTILRGDRHTTVCTLSVSRNELEPAWEAEDETEYETGASTHTGYDSLVISWSERRLRDTAVRSRESLRDVYSRLRIPAAWNQQADAQAVFIDDEGFTITLYTPVIEIASDLPLDARGDYSSDLSTIPAWQRYGSQPILVAFPRPTDETKWIAAKALGNACAMLVASDRGGNYTVAARGEGDALRLVVDGAPQHAIAGADFTPLPADTLQLGNLDYRDAEITLALRDERYVEGRWPEELVDSADVIRRRLLYAGDTYRRIRIVPETIVDVDTEGAFVRSPGGYLVDDTAKLQSLAKLYHTWHGSPHRTLDVTTQRLTADILVGDLIGSVGKAADGPINSAVTVVEITMPIGRRPPAMRVVTASFRADPFAGLFTTE